MFRGTQPMGKLLDVLQASRSCLHLQRSSPSPSPLHLSLAEPWNPKLVAPLAASRASTRSVGVASNQQSNQQRKRDASPALVATGAAARGPQGTAAGARAPGAPARGAAAGLGRGGHAVRHRQHHRAGDGVRDGVGRGAPRRGQHHGPAHGGARAGGRGGGGRRDGTAGGGGRRVREPVEGVPGLREREQQRHREVPVLRGHADRVPAVVAGGDGAMIGQRGRSGREGKGTERSGGIELCRIESDTAGWWGPIVG
jgi:hypothetical protein